MDMHSCPFCSHSNPAAAKYCADCGGCLYLVPCPSCGAVNDVKATSCYECHGPMRGAAVGVGPSAAPVAVIAKPDSAGILSRAVDTTPVSDYPMSAAGAASPRSPSSQTRMVIAAGVLALLAASGYYAWRQQVSFNARPPTAAGGDLANRGAGGAASTGTIDVAAGTAAVAAPAEKGKAAVAASPLVVAVPATANEPPAAARAESAKAGGAEACTDASAALGLCTPQTLAPPSAALPAITHTQRKE